jgi:predicted dehydrogenase
MDAFLMAVETGGPAPVAGTEIVALQRLIDALYVSLRSGREVSLAPG